MLIIVDQILDLIAGVYFDAVCDLNLLKIQSPRPPPPHFFIFFFLAFSYLNVPPTIEIRQSNRHFHALDIALLSF